jgi:hypothetical protein
MRAPLLLLVCAAGCFKPSYSNGGLRCEDGKCPRGYHCAANDTCWKNGSDPQIDLAGPTDLSPPPDLLIVKHQGDPCTGTDVCDTGQCVDGYCCDSACNNGCQACDVAGKLGTCTTVAAGNPHGTRSCTNLGMSPCGGSCNGSLGTCFYPDNSVACGASTCSSQTQVQKRACDSAGNCIAAATTCPNNFICSGSDCLTACSHNSDCAPANGFGCRNDHVCTNFCVFDTDTFDHGCIYAP